MASFPIRHLETSRFMSRTHVSNLGETPMNARFSMALLKGAALLSVMLAGALPAAAAPTIFVDQNATYRCINATTATTQVSPGPNWFKPGFDDSGWFVGQGPFSSTAV